MRRRSSPPNRRHRQRFHVSLAKVEKHGEVNVELDACPKYIVIWWLYDGESGVPVLSCEDGCGVFLHLPW